MPVPAATPTCAETSALTRSSFETFVMKALVRSREHDRPDEGNTEGGTELLTGVLQPARLGSTGGVDRGLHDVAELRGEQAHADSEQAHRPGEGRLVELDVDRAHQDHRGQGERARPVRTMPRTVKRVDNREPTIEATNMAIETGSILIPVSSASRPEDDLQIERDDEEDAHQDQVLRQQADRAPT